MNSWIFYILGIGSFIYLVLLSVVLGQWRDHQIEAGAISGVMAPAINPCPWSLRVVCWIDSSVIKKN